MKFVISFLVLIFVCSAVQAERTCDELADIGDIGIRKILLASPNASIPQSPEAIQEYCSETKKIYKGLNEYKKCLKLFPKEVFSTVISSFGKVLKENCATDEGKEKSLKAFQCINDENKKEFNKCLIGSLNVIDQFSKSNEGRAVLVPKLCCLHVAATECVNSKLPEKCPDANISIKNYINNLHQTLTESVVALACGVYKDAKTCDEKLPNDIKQIRETVNAGESILGERKIVKLLINLSDKIGN